MSHIEKRYGNLTRANNGILKWILDFETKRGEMGKCGERPGEIVCFLRTLVPPKCVA
jgi:hypothetical protein